MFLKIAIKNIVAYKRRSIVTVALTCFTTALLVFASAFWDGSHNKMIESAVEIYPGYLQITQKDFRKIPSYDNLIFDARSVRNALTKISGIDTFGERFESFVLFSSREKAVGGMFTGIEPEKEERLSRLKKSLKKGEYLSPGDHAKLYIGTELAKRLKVDVGDVLSFVGTGADYSFAADNVTVKGIFQTGLFDFDASAAFVSKSYFDYIMAAQNYATHFIVLPEKPQDVEDLAATISRKLGSEYQALSWQKTMAGLVQAMKVDSIFGYITLSIIFIVIFFVIMIYTLLAVFARVREIGILRAVGTTPSQILRLLVLESVLLGLVSVVAGGLIGGALAYYFQLHPIVFPGYEEQFKQYGLAASAMPAIFSLSTIVRDMIVMFVLTVLSTLYPILKVNGYRPIEAIRHV
ncbi:MAG: ABC transporter permease [Desulfobulbaceae bacterium]|nr:ABC transporter permease [Desulfobulbaceae bacterium]MCK5545476.1 ABC transporter permease [Desulfobulbaceae bacterium]